jgi:peptide deformylase
MPILSVKKMGEKSLLEPSLPIKKFSSRELYELIDNLKATMQAQDGVGIAAPQIGFNQRVVIFGFDQCKRYPGEARVPFTILINPKIKFLTDEVETGWEACLSVPGLRGLVPRYTHILYEGFDAEGRFISCHARGFHARIVQHEVDHLDGILYPFRMKDLRSLGFAETPNS